LDHVFTQPVWQTSPDEQLALVVACQQVLARAEAAQAHLLAAIDTAETTQTQLQLTTAEWLQRTNRVAAPTARSVVDAARKLARFTGVRDARGAGEVSWWQAQAMVDGLAHLPADLTSAEVAQAEQLLLERADEFDPAYLRRLANGLVNIVAPDAADAADRAALDRLEAQARKDRFLRWRPDGHGSTHFHGKLPTLGGGTPASSRPARPSARKGRTAPPMRSLSLSKGPQPNVTSADGVPLALVADLSTSSRNASAAQTPSQRR